MGRVKRWLKGLFGIAKSNTADPGNSNRGRNNSKHHDIDVLSFENDPEAVLKDEFYASRTARLRASSSSCYLETHEERNKHAVAVVVATAAAADAALVAARAAAEVVRLTGPGSRVMDSVRELGKGDYESFAAIKIQSFFRGYLARKALRALKGLVKLQAMVRGYLVRKQAKATLRSMEALMRAQAMARFRRSHRPLPNITTIHSSRSRMYSMAQEVLNEIEDSYGAPIHSRRLSASLDVRTTETVHQNLKIVEVDHVRPLSRPYPNTNMYDIHYTGLSPVFPSHNAYKPPVLEDSPRYSSEYVCLSSKSTPRFLEPIGSNHHFVGKPVEGRLVPSYMTSTQSFSAKSRSHSAPKQRPHRPGGDKNSRRLSLHEMMDVSRSSLSGIRMQRSCSKAQEVIHMKKQAVGG